MHLENLSLTWEKILFTKSITNTTLHSTFSKFRASMLLARDTMAPRTSAECNSNATLCHEEEDDDNDVCCCCSCWTLSLTGCDRRARPLIIMPRRRPGTSVAGFTILAVYNVMLIETNALKASFLTRCFLMMVLTFSFRVTFLHHCIAFFS